MSEREQDKTSTQKEEALTIKYKGHDFLDTHNDIDLHKLTLSGVANKIPAYSVMQANRLNGFI